MTKPNEPTLTCSEVVERLATEAHLAHGYCTGFSRILAEAILHSWRERRVQELEELLAKHSLAPEPQSTQLDATKEKVMATETRKWQMFIDAYGDKITAKLVEEGKLDYSLGITQEQLPWFNALRNLLVADGHLRYRPEDTNE